MALFTPRREAVRELKHTPEMRRLMSRVGLAAKREVQARTPVDTGRLQKSVRYELVETPDGWVVSVNFGRFYGRFVEFGTASQPPRPFLRPGTQVALRSFGGRFNTSR